MRMEWTIDFDPFIQCAITDICVIDMVKWVTISSEMYVSAKCSISLARSPCLSLSSFEQRGRSCFRIGKQREGHRAVMIIVAPQRIRYRLPITSDGLIRRSRYIKS